MSPFGGCDMRFLDRHFCDRIDFSGFEYDSWNTCRCRRRFDDCDWRRDRWNGCGCGRFGMGEFGGCGYRFR